MSKRDGKMRLGYFMGGGGGLAGWRHPDHPSDYATNLGYFQKNVAVAERGLLDFGFIADSGFITKDSIPYFLSRFEPMNVLSALSATSSHLGLVGTFTTSYSEPFTTARQLASLDKISGGRAGWNAVTSALAGLALNHGGEKLHEHGLRYRIAEEYIQVAKGLWDSWEDDAFVRDKATGRYVDLDKMHTLNHVGEFFKVQGPLNLERSAQGRPVVFQAGASEEGRELAAKEADAIFSSYDNAESTAAAQAFYADIKRRTVNHGRSQDDILIFPGLQVIIGSTQEEADRKYDHANSFLDIELAVRHLGRYFSHFDFSQFPLDEPLPELGDIGADSFKSTADFYKRLAREENLTLRQLALRAANPKGDFVGPPEHIANKLEELFRAKAADGFIIGGGYPVDGLADFVDHVIPILQRRGLFRTEYEHTTLRGNLGLDYPENRYAKARRLAAENDRPHLAKAS